MVAVNGLRYFNRGNVNAASRRHIRPAMIPRVIPTISPAPNEIFVPDGLDGVDEGTCDEIDIVVIGWVTRQPVSLPCFK